MRFLFWTMLFINALYFFNQSPFLNFFQNSTQVSKKNWKEQSIKNQQDFLQHIQLLTELEVLPPENKKNAINIDLMEPSKQAIPI